MKDPITFPVWLRRVVIASIGTAWALIAFVVVTPYLDFGIFRQPATGVSDQLLQVILWSVTVVFTAGGALLGLNWYQGERRHQEQVETLNAFTSQVETKLDSLRTKLAEVSGGHDALARDVELLKLDLSITGMEVQGLTNEQRAERSTIITRRAIADIDRVIQIIKGFPTEREFNANAIYLDPFFDLLASLESLSADPDYHVPESVLRKIRELHSVMKERQPSWEMSISQLIQKLSR